MHTLPLGQTGITHVSVELPETEFFAVFRFDDVVLFFLFVVRSSLVRLDREPNVLTWKNIMSAITIETVYIKIRLLFRYT